MSSYRYRFVGYEKLPSGLNADDVQLHCRLPDRLVRRFGIATMQSATTSGLLSSFLSLP